MRAWLIRLLGGTPPMPGNVTARTLEEALRDDQVDLSRRERRILTAKAMAALEQLGYRFGN